MGATATPREALSGLCVNGSGMEKEKVMSETTRVRRVFGLLRVVAALLAWIALVGSPALALAGQPRTEPGAGSGQEDPAGDAIDEMRFRDLEDQLRRLREELSAVEQRLVAREALGSVLDLGPCEDREVSRDPSRTIYEEEVPGFVVAALNYGPAGGPQRRGIQGFVATERESLEANPIESRFRRGGASAQYHGLDTYLLYSSLTMPVGSGESWVLQIGYGDAEVSSNVMFCPLVLKAG